MKVGDVYSAAAQIAASGTQKTDGQTSGVRNRQAQTTEASYRSDRSELSSVANLMSASSEMHSAARAERVARLRSEFLAGRHEPDSALISRAIVQSALVDSGR
jgi:anti-sigma28 factor (negative regulator of flagellin synthesis)